MARRTKKALLELDEAIDHLGGGVTPLRAPAVSRPRKSRKAAAKGKARGKRR